MCVFRSDYEYYVATRVKFYFFGGGFMLFLWSIYASSYATCKNKFVIFLR